MTYSYQLSSTIYGVALEDVWNRIETWDGVNYELGPFVRMSVPSQYSRVSDVPADGIYHFAAKIILLGFLPVDRHKFGLAEINPPHYFDEKSQNTFMSSWRHKRTLRAVGDEVVLTDECSFEPRWNGMGRLLLLIYQFIFRRRHDRLGCYFGSNRA